MPDSCESTIDCFLYVLLILGATRVAGIEAGFKSDGTSSEKYEDRFEMMNTYSNERRYSKTDGNMPLSRGSQVAF